MDLKILTCIEEERIRETTPRTILQLQLAFGGNKCIAHGIAMARDAISAAGTDKCKCGILDTDLVAAFCNRVATWCFKVMRKKGLSVQVLDQYHNLYDNNIPIVTVHNIQGKSFQNTRYSVRQGN